MRRLSVPDVGVPFSGFASRLLSLSPHQENTNTIRILLRKSRVHIMPGCFNDCQCLAPYRPNLLSLFQLSMNTGSSWLTKFWVPITKPERKHWQGLTINVRCQRLLPVASVYMGKVRYCIVSSENSI